MNVNIKKLINNNEWDKIYDFIKNNKIDAGYEISNGNTVAHIVALNNQEKIILYLLKHNSETLQKSNNDGNTPIFLLAIYGYINLLKKCISINNNSIDFTNNNDETIFHILYNDFDFIKWTLKKDNNIPLNLDIEGDNILTKNINDTQKINDVNYNIIHLIIDKYIDELNKNGHDSLLCYAMRLGKQHVAELLINGGYNVNKLDSRFQSPFMYATKQNNMVLVELLIKNKCDINYTGPEGDQNPLIWAIVTNNIQLINILLDNGFNVRLYNRYMESPLHYALARNNLSPTIITKLLYYGDLNMKNIYGQTPLHFICMKHNWKYYYYVMETKELDIFVEDNKGKKPFDYLNGNYIYDFIDLAISSYTKLLNNNIQHIEECKADAKNETCRVELRKYMFKLRRSIPIEEDSMIINQKIKDLYIFNKTNDIQFNGFNSDSLHNMIYMICLLKKYPNVCIPFQYYFNDKYINDKILLNTTNLYKTSVEQVITDLVHIYFEYFYEILPYLILWRSANQYYIHPNLKFLLKKCIASPKIRFIILKLTLITSSTGTHANIIIYDKIKNTLERFEPYGVIPYLESNQLDKFIENMGREYINANLKYYSPKDIFGTIGFQTISNDSNVEVKNIQDPVGFCLSWTFWYLEMRVNNPDIEPHIFIKREMENIIDGNIGNTNNNSKRSFINYIRKYAGTLDEQKNNFMLNAGIDKNSIYNTVLSNGNQNKLLHYMEKEFHQLVKEKH